MFVFQLTSYGVALHFRTGEGLGAYIAEITLDDEESWNNKSKIVADIDGEYLDINDKMLYNRKIPEGVPYSCPAGSYVYNFEWELSGIGLLSELKCLISKPGEEQKVIEIRNKLIEWMETLKHVDDVAKENFIKRVNSLGRIDSSCVIL